MPSVTELHRSCKDFLKFPDQPPLKRWGNDSPKGVIAHGHTGMESELSQIAYNFISSHTQRTQVLQLSSQVLDLPNETSEYRFCLAVCTVAFACSVKWKPNHFRARCIASENRNLLIGLAGDGKPFFWYFSAMNWPVAPFEEQGQKFLGLYIKGVSGWFQSVLASQVATVPLFSSKVVSPGTQELRLCWPGWL
jgi:hypothetical protein